MRAPFLGHSGLVILLIPDPFEVPQYRCKSRTSLGGWSKLRKILKRTAHEIKCLFPPIGLKNIEFGFHQVNLVSLYQVDSQNMKNMDQSHGLKTSFLNLIQAYLTVLQHVLHESPIVILPPFSYEKLTSLLFLPS